MRRSRSVCRAAQARCASCDRSYGAGTAYCPEDGTRLVRRLNPDAKVVATGCAAQMALNQGETLSEAHLVVPNPDKLDTLDHVLRAYPELTPRERAPRPSEPSGRTRATLKVQEPPKRKAGIKVADVADLVKRLKEEAKVI